MPGVRRKFHLPHCPKLWSHLCSASWGMPALRFRWRAFEAAGGVSITFVVDEKDAEQAVKVLHKEYIER